VPLCSRFTRSSGGCLVFGASVGWPSRTRASRSVVPVAVAPLAVCARTCLQETMSGFEFRKCLLFGLVSVRHLARHREGGSAELSPRSRVSRRASRPDHLWQSGNHSEWCRECEAPCRYCKQGLKVVFYRLCGWCEESSELEDVKVRVRQW